MSQSGPLRVGLLTSWNTRCGIAEYSRYIAERLRLRPEIELVVIGSQNQGRWCLAEDEEWVRALHRVPFMNQGTGALDVEGILSLQLDVLHLQYQQHLYDVPRLHELIERFSGVLVVTYHDNCFPDDFPDQAFDLRYSHREGVGRGELALIPHGVENHAPVIKTFGLGRSRDDLVAPICERHGWRLEKFFGGQEDKWMTQTELRLWLRDSDAIVLWYDESSAAGTSGATRIALSTRRPVITNDSSWFADLPKEGEPTYHQVSDITQLEQTLEQVLSAPILERDSWERVVSRHVSDYLRLTGRPAPAAPSWSVQERPDAEYAVSLEAVPALASSVGAAKQHTLSLRLANHSGRPLSASAEQPVFIRWQWLSEAGAHVETQPLPVLLTPGAEQLVSLTLTTPEQPGRWQLQVSLQEGEVVFSDRLSSSQLLHPISVLPLSGAPLQRPRAPIIASARQALIAAQMPTSARLGEELSVPVRIINLGREELYAAPPAPVMVGVRWHDPQGRLIGESPRMPLPKLVGAGDTAEVIYPMLLPRQGLYVARIGLVQADQWWEATHDQVLLVR